jgi:HTH-type transcriptional regulator/antitoxin HigA
MTMDACLTDVPHPGEFIRDELEARGWSQRDLAYILGSTEQAVNLIVSGKRGISTEMAKALGNAFDVSAEYFANLQQMYEMAHTKAPDPGISRRATLQKVYPIREMIKRAWIADTGIDLLELQVMRFFCKNSLADVPYLQFAAKKSNYTETSPTQFAWLFRCKQMASEMIVPSYSEQKLKAFVSDIPRHMVDPEEIRHVPRTLAEAGIRFVVVETLPKADIDGVCFWLDDASPVIGVTVRHDRIDNFWFVLRHEIEHVLNRDGKGDLRVETVDVDIENANGNLPPSEATANRAAAECCVPQDQLESFYVRKYPFISERDTLAFSKRIQRHPGIVVGQIQRKMNRYDWLSKYKVKIRQYLVGAANVDGWGVAAPISL